jgi:hypothetical protein
MCLTLALVGDGNPDLSVRIAMGYGPDSWGSILGGGRDFSLLHSIQTGSGAHQPVGTRGYFPGSKAAEA